MKRAGRRPAPPKKSSALTNTVVSAGGLDTKGTGTRIETGTLEQSDPILALKAKIARLQTDNNTLKAQVAALSAPPRSPDDFASALQRTVNNLQGRLATLSNPVSNFAVKEFRIEAPVGISITK